MTNVIDTEKLGSYIVELKNLHTEWAAKNIELCRMSENVEAVRLFRLRKWENSIRKCRRHLFYCWKIRFPTWNREKARLRRKKRHIQKHFLHRKKKKAWG